VLGIANWRYRSGRTGGFQGDHAGSSETGSMNVGKIELPSIVDPQSGTHVTVSMHKTAPDVPKTEFECSVMHGCTDGLMFAIGVLRQPRQPDVPDGVNLKWARQDDNGKLTDALVAFATDLSQGNPNQTRAHTLFASWVTAAPPS